MQQYIQVPSSDLKDHGRVVGNTLYLPEGIHTRDRKPSPTNELFIKERHKNPREKQLVQTV